MNRQKGLSARVAGGKEAGEIATILTLAAVGLLAVGGLVGSLLIRKTSLDTRTQAAAISDCVELPVNGETDDNSPDRFYKPGKLRFTNASGKVKELADLCQGLSLTERYCADSGDVLGDTKVCSQACLKTADNIGYCSRQGEPTPPRENQSKTEIRSFQVDRQPSQANPSLAFTAEICSSGQNAHSVRVSGEIFRANQSILGAELGAATFYPPGGCQTQSFRMNMDAGWSQETCEPRNVRITFDYTNAEFPPYRCLGDPSVPVDTTGSRCRYYVNVACAAPTLTPTPTLKVTPTPRPPTPTLTLAPSPPIPETVSCRVSPIVKKDANNNNLLDVQVDNFNSDASWLQLTMADLTGGTGVYSFNQDSCQGRSCSFTGQAPVGTTSIAGGDYWVFCSAGNGPIGGSDGFGQTQCTGNPFNTPTYWEDCGTQARQRVSFPYPSGSPTPTPAPLPTAPAPSGQTRQFDWQVETSAGNWQTICWLAKGFAGCSENKNENTGGGNGLSCQAVGDSIRITNNSGGNKKVACQRYVCSSCLTDNNGKARCENSDDRVGTHQFELINRASATCDFDGASGGDSGGGESCVNSCNSSEGWCTSETSCRNGGGKPVPQCQGSRACSSSADVCCKGAGFNLSNSDLDNDGKATAIDWSIFVSLFKVKDSRADINKDKVVNIWDVIEFLKVFKNSGLK